MGMGVHSHSRGRGGRRAPMAEINVTPFVDIMLVLLIIFMVTAPMLASGVPVDLPDSRANALDQEPDQITIALDGAGTVFVDDAPVADGALGQAVDGLGCQRQESPLVALRADRTLDYGRIMTVMGELNRAGCNRISLVTNGSVEAP